MLFQPQDLVEVGLVSLALQCPFPSAEGGSSLGWWPPGCEAGLVQLHLHPRAKTAFTGMCKWENKNHQEMKKRFG